ncbi:MULTISPECIES: hypothetical protein [unclassified Curtobacterium]|uniref:hypothetical protein n=1 Tax=unclassified Curtobacterium TaxID=257496 RepID=UPI0039B0C4A7
MSGRARGAAAGTVLALTLTLAACSAPPTGGTPVPSTPSTPTVQHQRDLASTYVAATMRTSGVLWDDAQENAYAQECRLGDGTSGALDNLTRIGAGLPDPQAAVQTVGRSWAADGLTVQYSESSLNDGSRQFVVKGAGGDVERIQFGAATTRSSLAAVSHCGTGDAADLG